MPSGVATSYGPPWGGIQGGGTTATGIDLHSAPHKLIVAVDPSVIPLGSKLRVWPNPFGDPNLIFTAADTGGAIKSPHVIDFYDWRGRGQQLGFGKKNVSYKIVGKGDPKAAGMLDGADSAAAAPASAGGGGIVGTLAGPLLRALLYVALIVGGAVLVIYGLYTAANAGSGGRAGQLAKVLAK